MSEYIETTLGDVLFFEDGDRGKNYPKQNELNAQGECLFLSTKNLPGAGFDFSQKTVYF